jgi:hypothetical protein
MQQLSAVDKFFLFVLTVYKAGSTADYDRYAVATTYIRSRAALVPVGEVSAQEMSVAVQLAIACAVQSAVQSRQQPAAGRTTGSDHSLLAAHIQQQLPAVCRSRARAVLTRTASPGAAPAGTTPKTRWLWSSRWMRPRWEQPSGGVQLGHWL